MEQLGAKVLELIQYRLDQRLIVNIDVGFQIAQVQRHLAHFDFRVFQPLARLQRRRSGLVGVFDDGAERGVRRFGLAGIKGIERQLELSLGYFDVEVGLLIDLCRIGAGNQLLEGFPVARLGNKNRRHQEDHNQPNAPLPHWLGWFHRFGSMAIRRCLACHCWSG